MKRFLISLLLIIPMQLFSQNEGFNQQNSTNQPFTLSCDTLSLSNCRSANNQHFWLKFGPGIYNDIDDGGLSLYGSLTIEKKYMYKLRYIYNEELQLFEHSEQFNDIGLLFGVSKTYEWTKISAYGGLGIVTGMVRGDFISYGDGGWFSPSEYEWDYFTTVGIPIELEFSILPHQLLGVGFSMFGNINSVNSMGGFIVKIEIGR